MKYIYDITLNLHHEYYDFYEWSIYDKIINIKKIPIFRVSSEDYLSIKYNDVIIKNNLGNLILITNTLEVMGVLFQKGKVIKRSSLLINEGDKILDSVQNMSVTKIIFEKNVYRKRVIVDRSNIEKRKYIDAFLKRIDEFDDPYFFLFDWIWYYDNWFCLYCYVFKFIKYWV